MTFRDINTVSFRTIGTLSEDWGMGYLMLFICKISQFICLEDNTQYKVTHETKSC